jgi:hypothetical protein
MVQVRLRRDEPDTRYARDRNGNIVSVLMTTCTTLDHIYPSNYNRDGVQRPNTKCHCGQRTWGGTGKRVSIDGARIFTVRIKKRQLSEEESVMSKKVAKKVVAAKKSTASGRSWNRTYVFVKSLKVEPAKDTIVGCVYAGIKSIKSGNADEVTAAALKVGLRNVTGQDPRVQTMVWLRRLAADGAVRVDAADKGKAAPAKASAKAAQPKKKVVLKKTAA